MALEIQQTVKKVACDIKERTDKVEFRLSAPFSPGF